MVRSFFGGTGLRVAAAVAALLALLSLVRVCARADVPAFFGMLFPQLVCDEATPGEAVAL